MMVQRRSVQGCNMGFAHGHVESFSLPELGYSVSIRPEDPPFINNRAIAESYFRLTTIPR